MKLESVRVALLSAVGITALSGLGIAGEMGEIKTDFRLRHETAEIDGVEDGDNTSARLRLGFFSKDLNGFKLGVEGEFTAPFDKDSYNAAGVHGDSDKAVIADPESQDLDQLFIAYKMNDTVLKAGRQVITLDGHRFVGHVGWRQNRQTYDAFTVTDNSVENLTLFYGYVDNVIRIFGSDAPDSGGNAGEADSESHLLNGSYAFSDTLTLTVYAYLLELDDVPAALSTDSIGASLKGVVPVGEQNVNWHAEYASQSEAGENPLDYTADYIHVNAASAIKGLTLTLGYEVLGSDESGVDEDGAPVYASFKTPLATLHKFNGFADRFLVTPATGLEDVYASLSYKVPVPGIGPVAATVAYHDFTSDEGSDDLGDEVDAVLAKGFKVDGVPGAFKGIAKYAAYDKGDTGADTDRFSVEVNYSASF